MDSQPLRRALILSLGPVSSFHTVFYSGGSAPILFGRPETALGEVEPWYWVSAPPLIYHVVSGESLHSQVLMSCVKENIIPVLLVLILICVFI